MDSNDQPNRKKVGRKPTGRTTFLWSTRFKLTLGEKAEKYGIDIHATCRQALEKAVRYCEYQEEKKQRKNKQ